MFHEAKNPGDDINDTCINSRQLINILKEPDTSLWMPDATENSCTGNIITDLSNNSELSKSGEKVNAKEILFESETRPPRYNVDKKNSSLKIRMKRGLRKNLEQK